MSKSKMSLFLKVILVLIIVVCIAGVIRFFITPKESSTSKSDEWFNSMKTLEKALDSYAKSHGGSYPATQPNTVIALDDWLAKNNIKLDKPIVNPFWPNAKVGISTDPPLYAVDTDQPIADGATIAWLQYLVGGITNASGEFVENGLYTIRYKLGEKVYTIPSPSGE